MQLNILGHHNGVDLVEFKSGVAVLQPIKELGQRSVVGKPGIEVADLGREKLSIAIGRSLASSVKNDRQDKVSTEKYRRTTGGQDQVSQNGSVKGVRSFVLVGVYSMT